MPACMHRLARLGPRPPVLLVTLLLAVVTSAPARAEELPADFETVFIAYLVELDTPADDVTNVRISFEVLEPEAEAEIFILAVFDAGSQLLLTHTPLLSEQMVSVDGYDALQPEAIWIDQPPVPMQWLELALDWPLPPNSGNLLFAIGMSPEQLRRETGLIPHLEKECDEPRTYFSTDRGLSWDRLDVAALECLRKPNCEENGSTNLRINVRPC